MLTQEQLTAAQQRAYEYLTRAGIVLTEQERANIEVADLGLGDLTHTGLELINDKRRSPPRFSRGRNALPVQTAALRPQGVCISSFPFVK